MSENLSIDQEYELVYQGIVAVAAHCDGARTEDGVGFNGQDTLYGRRVATVPFVEWTDAVKVECARIANTYQRQILGYTGIDVSTLSVVDFAKDCGTNHSARDDARGYERKRRNGDKVALRKVDVAEGSLAIFFDLKDPDKNAVMDATRALPGRRFNGHVKCWEVPNSPELGEFIVTWDYPVTDEAAKLMSAPAPDQVYLSSNGQKVIIDTPYEFSLAEAIKGLPGRAWDAGRKINTADIHPAVAVLAEKFNLRISPDARYACEKAAEALKAVHAAELAAEDLGTIMAHVSRQADPDRLPPAFIELLEGVLSA